MLTPSERQLVVAGIALCLLCAATADPSPVPEEDIVEVSPMVAKSVVSGLTDEDEQETELVQLPFDPRQEKDREVAIKWWLDTGLDKKLRNAKLKITSGVSKKTKKADKHQNTHKEACMKQLTAAHLAVNVTTTHRFGTSTSCHKVRKQCSQLLQSCSHSSQSKSCQQSNGVCAKVPALCKWRERRVGSVDSCTGVSAVTRKALVAHHHEMLSKSKAKAVAKSEHEADEKKKVGAKKKAELAKKNAKKNAKKKKTGEAASKEAA